ncbi:hypothetical protein EV426DRAFT_48891 [Tirmania nivea]|nr:hypothetical protein EV426DRAFT_48891 [Tirmania nivea]
MMETQSAHPPPTRYKTVRRANPSTQYPNAGTTAPSAPIPSPQQQPGNSDNDALVRSRSRYRRRPTIDTTVAPVPIPIVPISVPQLPKEFQRDNQPALTQPGFTVFSPQESRPPRTVLPSSPTTEHCKNHLQSPVAQTPTAGFGGFYGQTERKINVQIGKETLAVAVPPETEASTLAAIVSKLVPEKTIYSASILLESFKGLGLERPVRKYERIRDIMNGWEDDTRNTLILISSLSGGEGLNACDAPVESPPEAYAWLSYMVKPGKWSKRWFIMRDGAILISKKETKKDKDLQHVCHLSDFDIYDPTPTTASNVLKCPKRHCFAIKSQQKASLFQNTADWVHYFSTNDRNIYTTWQNLLRSWRSYYLVQVKGYGQSSKSKEKSSSEDEERKKEEDKPLSKTRTLSRPPTSDTAGSNGRKKFTPLISEEELAKPPSLTIDTSIQRSKSLKATSRGHGITTTSPTAPELPKGEVFAPTGLLGRTYTQKVKEMQDAEKEQRRQNVPLFTPDSALGNLSNNLPVRTLTMRDHRTFTMRDHKRASSVESALNFEPKHHTDAARANQSGISRQKSLSKQMQKPLIDFSDSEQPPLPRSRYRARTLVNNGALSSGGLISGATGPANYDAPPLPNSVLWNMAKSRPGTRDKDHGNQQFMYGPQGNPFTGTGLLAYSQEGAGAVSKGHGVYRKGADGTLLDMRNKSLFVQGSLLAKVEKEKPDVPIIDRGQDSDS